ncbi:phage antirepressor KilAC domain-containing protein [Aggregatibacter actinomycetemcomitans]|uniref:phage antirepressor KilAC domain-containing protein n=1 Tax=Aggregatibacter actinomycetemcomitans TaxID=714 RepID=UPI0021508BB7|nr:phage antirepressor KilAC domain-containing protein [Aggregatibacter actinomycetemcomitans]
MKTKIQLYDTQIRQDEQGRFCLNDLHQASGGESRHRPAYWLSNQQTQDLIGEISKDGIPSILTKQGLGTFVSKELVYAYAMWISPKFHLYVIRTFDSLASHQNPTALLPDFTNPAESARAWAEEYEKRQIAEQQAALMKPKADFVDNYVSAGGSKSLRETAKILKMPERDLIMKLISDKCLYRTSGNGNLLPYQSRHSQDLFTVKTGVTDNGHNYTQTRVTAKGIQWIANRYASELMS